MASSGPFVGPNYHLAPPTLYDNKVASVTFGATLGVGFLTGWKAMEQSINVWCRKKWSWYILMVWVLWTVCIVQGVLCWCLMGGVLPVRFETFFASISIWAIQTQLLLQIIINRSTLIMNDKRKGTTLRWGTFLFIGMINISVFCIWIPARLQISQTFIKINNVWDRTEKVLFLCVDASLNAYFLYLVKSRLIAYGLSKYKALFKFNSVIVLVSLSMDGLVIGMMNLRNSFSYSQFHGLAYMVKLHIELVMTDLIVRIVRAPLTQDYNTLVCQLQPITTRNNTTKSGKRDITPDARGHRRKTHSNRPAEAISQSSVKKESSLSGTTMDNEPDGTSVSNFGTQNLGVISSNLQIAPTSELDHWES